jgi:hypothetical protein
MDLPSVLAAGEALADRIEQEGLEGIPPAVLAPRLLAAGTG